MAQAIITLQLHGTLRKIKEMSFTQSADTLIICHPDSHAPRSIVRGGSHMQRGHFQQLYFHSYQPLTLIEIMIQIHFL